MTGQGLEANVSRETLDKLRNYEALLRKWNPRINLVAPSTLAVLWKRHILDSAQLFALAPHDVSHWVDLGSGGGLPGVVCAILASERAPEIRFTLVESDQRKAAFLAVCRHELGLTLTVRAARAENIDPLCAELVSARALAPLPQLLPLVARHLGENGTALLPKGKNHATELEAARLEWQFDCVSHVSQTDDTARTLALKDIKRV